MDPKTWDRVSEIFGRVIAAPPEQRATLLEQACGGDQALRAEVESLLEHDSQAGEDFLSPAVIRLEPEGDAVQDWVGRLLGERIGRYTVVGVLGRGGMGCVFEARQEKPARTVALKVLTPGLSTASALARFQLEPEVLGRLQHPNIAQVYEAGVHESELGSVPFFAMEYIAKALPLLDYSDQHGLSLRERLAMFAKICDAVHHGHQKGIIHRDLKPGNILVGSDGEPKVIDFGVARASDADILLTTQHTQVGDLVGTVRYMSPEQCDGNPAAIDIRSDVYSLGVVLYELLTGCPPYDTSVKTLYGAVRVIKEEPPRRPSEVLRARKDRVPGLSRSQRDDLDVVLLKALDKERSRRYASAAELAEDLRNILDERPIRARPPSLLYLAGKYVRRNRWKTLALATALVCVAAALGTWLMWTSLLETRAQRKREVELRRQAEEARRIVEISKYGRSIMGAESALHLGDAGGARQLLEDPTYEAFRGWEWYHLRSRVDMSHRIIGQWQGCSVINPAIDPTGRWLVVTVEPNPATVSTPFGHDRVFLLSLEGGQGDRADPIELAALDEACSAFTPDGLLIVGGRTAPQPYELRVYDLGKDPFAPGAEPPRLLARRDVGYSLRLFTLSCSPIEPLLVMGFQDRVECWDLSGVREGDVPERLATVRVGYEKITRATFSPDGVYLAVVESESRAINLFEVNRLKHGEFIPCAVLSGHTYHVWGLTFSPDSHWFASASLDGTVRLWDMEAIRGAIRRGPGRNLKGPPFEVEVYREKKVGFSEVTFDPDGVYLAATGNDNLIYLWEYNRLRGGGQDGSEASESRVYSPLPTLRGHERVVRFLGVASSGELITTSADGTVRAWWPGRPDVPRLRGHGTSVKAVAFSPDGRWLISADGGTGLIVWDAALGIPVATCHVFQSGKIHALRCWEMEGRTFLAAACRANRYSPENIALARLLFLRELVPVAHGASGQSLALKPIPVPPEYEQERLRSMPREQDEYEGFRSLSVGRGGRRLAVTLRREGVHVWEFSREAGAFRRFRILPLTGETEYEAVFLDEHGDWLATMPVNERIEREVQPVLRVWDVNTGAEVAGSPFHSGHAAGLFCVTVDDAFTWLATGDTRGKVGLWRIDRSQGTPTLRWVRLLQGNADFVRSLAFCTAGWKPRLASSAMNGTIDIWELEAGELQGRLRIQTGYGAGLGFDAAGRRLACASWGYLGSGNMVSLWESGPDADDPGFWGRRARWMEAHRRVLDAVWDSDLNLEAARKRFERWQPRTAYGRDVKRLALEHFERFLTRPDLIGEAVWRWVSVPGRELREYEQALHWARVAEAMAPEFYAVQALLGAAAYRCGRYEEAMSALMRAEALRRDFCWCEAGSPVIVNAFLALTRLELGDWDAAADALLEAEREYQLIPATRFGSPAFPHLEDLLNEVRLRLDTSARGGWQGGLGRAPEP